MKIGILTFYRDMHNYGQRLQNYALQEILKNMGHEVFSFQKCCNQWLNQDDLFKIFDNEYMNTVKVWNINNFGIYDCFLYGSDQVLNFQFVKSERILDLFEVISSNVNKMFTYAASDGWNDLDKDLQDTSKNNFFNTFFKIKNISFREYDSYIKFKNKGYNVNYHIDPVFLLDIKDWELLEKKTRF